MKLRFSLSSISSRFLNSYGKHIVLIYAIYNIVFSALLFVSLTVSILGFLGIVVFITFFAFWVLHTIINAKLIKKEYYPHQLLYHQHIKSLIFFISGLCLIGLVLIWGLVGAYITEQIFTVSVSQIFTVSILLFTSLVFPSLFFSMFSFTDHKEARLCFKSILKIFEKILQDKAKRIKIASRNLRWFRQAFRSCNSVLVHKPYTLELKELDRYHNAIYTAMLIGNSKEIKQMSKSVENVLDSLGAKRKDIQLRELLIALRHITEKGGRNKKESLIDLSDLWKTSSRLDRLKARIKSPVTVSIVAIVTLIITVLALLFQTFKS